MTNATPFTSAGRNLDREEKISLVSVGVDIGSSTSHLLFSRISLQKDGNRYIVSKREVLYESDVLLTPYASDLTIDASALRTFIDAQYATAGVSSEEIDTGALILTGVAVRRSNARAIADLFSKQAGKFVAVTAGDAMETLLVAYGSGAISRSDQDRQLRVMNVDVGGGTSKIAVCMQGRVTDFTVIDVGARVISFDNERRIARIEESGRFFARKAGVASVAVGDTLPAETIHKIVEIMADTLVQAIGACALEDDANSLFRLPPLSKNISPDVITFSGGVSEYIYGRENGDYGDLGPLLAAAIRAKIRGWQPKLELPAANIRATVIGTSQETIQVTGNTIFAMPTNVLPIRNVPVVAPILPLGSERLDADEIAEVVKSALKLHELADRTQPVAIYYRWQGSATFSRLDSFCQGIIKGLSSVLPTGVPLIMVTDGDVGGLIGIHCREICHLANPIVSIDGILLKTFDFIDIGAFLETSGVVPVVVKSLVFTSHAPNRADLLREETLA
jgi:ethanolamine utilization protein EutA